MNTKVDELCKIRGSAFQSPVTPCFVLLHLAWSPLHDVHWVWMELFTNVQIVRHSFLWGQTGERVTHLCREQALAPGTATVRSFRWLIVSSLNRESGLCSLTRLLDSGETAVTLPARARDIRLIHSTLPVFVIPFLILPSSFFCHFASILWRDLSWDYFSVCGLPS